jgi:tRNA 2-thiocytidine biosynthesis protein TtcA
VDLEKTLLRKVGEAIHRFKMIRDGDRIAVAVSGGKDSVTMLEACCCCKSAPPSISPSARSPWSRANSSRPSKPSANTSKAWRIDWTYHTDNPSLKLLEDQPDHGCDLCSRFRRRAVYQIARGLGANVIAFGHTADDLCESLFRNILFTGRLSSLPAVTIFAQARFPPHPPADLRD